MNREDACRCLVAARGNPFLAAWVSVLDAHQMPHRTAVAPCDWEAAFEDLFQLGLVAAAEFNAVDFKREFRKRTPPERDIEAALAQLATLRSSNDTQEPAMPKFEI